MSEPVADSFSEIAKRLADIKKEKEQETKSQSVQEECDKINSNINKTTSPGIKLHPGVYIRDDENNLFEIQFPPEGFSVSPNGKVWNVEDFLASLSRLKLKYLNAF